MSATPSSSLRTSKRLSRPRLFSRASFRGSRSTVTTPAKPPHTPSAASNNLVDNSTTPVGLSNFNQPPTPVVSPDQRPESDLFTWHPIRQSDVDECPPCPDAPFPPNQSYNTAPCNTPRSCVDEPENASNVSSSDQDPSTPRTAAEERFSVTPNDILSPSASTVSSPLNQHTSTRFQASSSTTSDTSFQSATSRPVSAKIVHDSEPSAMCFPLVGESDADVPSAPFSSRSLPGPSWAVYDERVRALEDDLYLAQQNADSQRISFEQRNNALEILVEELRTKLAASEEEVKDTGLQLKETRLRMGRRIREMEAELEAERNMRVSEANKQQKVHHQLQAELSLLRGQHLPRSRSYADSRSATSTTEASVSEHMSFSDSRSDHASLSGEAAAPPSDNSQTPSDLDREEELSSFPGATRATTMKSTIPAIPRSKSSSATSRTSVKPSPRRRATAPDTSCRRSKDGAEWTRDGIMSPRALNRRDVARRALLNHIHGPTYRNIRAAWYDFFAPHGTRVPSDKFMAAVRGLHTCPADLRDKDLEELRDEVSGNAEDGVVTWTNFVRFYQRTKHEVSLVS